MVAGRIVAASYVETITSSAVNACAVGSRPNRFEARRVKRRPEPYKLLQKHRNLYTTRDEKKR